MTTYGVTDEGFTRKPFTVIQSEMRDYLRTKISKHLQLTEKTGLGNVLNSAGDQLAEVWEAIEAAYHGFDKDNALDEAFVALCELTGTKRRAATKGVCATTCTFAGGVTYPPGALVAHVDGFAENRWVNRDEVVTVAAGSYPVTLEAETAGAQGKALAGALTKIAQPVTGWLTVTNAVAATPGADIESIEALYLRREQELALAGSGTLAAVKAAVSAQAGVVEVKGTESKTNHSFNIVVWDGISPAADDDEIAQTILDEGPAGIPSTGALTGTAVDDDGVSQSVAFDRATQTLMYVDVDVSGSTAGVADAILAEGAKLGIGATVVIEKLKGAVSALLGVTDIVNFKLGTSPAPAGTTNVVMGAKQKPLFDLSRINVS